MKKILYIGNSTQVAAAIHGLKTVELVAQICQNGRVSPEEMASGVREYPFIGVSSKKELQQQMESFYGQIDYAVMYSFGLIIPEAIIRNVDIFNFHPGNLRDNRGSSPINWSILLNHTEATMTLYKIGAAIDLGEVVSEHVCRIYPQDVPSTLRARLEGEIPSMMLELLDRNGKGAYHIMDGIYRERIREEDFTIHPGEDEQVVRAKLRSQYDYQGAILSLQNETLRVRTYEEYLAAISRQAEDV